MKAKNSSPRKASYTRNTSRNPEWSSRRKVPSKKEQWEKTVAHFRECSDEELEAILREMKAETEAGRKEAENGVLNWYVLNRVSFEKLSGSRRGRLTYETGEDMGQSTLEELASKSSTLFDGEMKGHGIIGLKWLPSGGMFIGTVILMEDGRVWVAHSDNISLILNGFGAIRIFRMLPDMKNTRSPEVFIQHDLSTILGRKAKKAASVMKISQKNLIASILKSRRGYILPPEQAEEKSGLSA